MNPETTTPETPTRAPLPRWLAPAGSAAIALCAGLVIGAVTASPNSACVEALDTADEAIRELTTPEPAGRHRAEVA